jgi:hypothetical protein
LMQGNLSIGSYNKIDPEEVQLSGTSVEFEHALEVSGWIYQWNGLDISNGTQDINESGPPPDDTGGQDLTFIKLVSLAAVDAVNPCALAVLSLMLIAIITYNPKNKRNILYAGFAFVLAVYLLYMFYGLVIIRFFQAIQALTEARLILYQILGLAAIILGILNLKDFFRYKPGGFGTEMPMRMRPRLKKILGGMTSPKGAFAIGAFVTIFLLPCTIGPYIIAGGLLSVMEIVEILPLLLVYNLVFVLPMIAITLVVYAGVAEIENVSEWKDKNIRYLHLVAGTIILILGAAMVLGLV